MKKRHIILVAGFALLSLGLLTACSSSKEASKTYSYVYSGDPETLDYVATNKKTMTTAVSNGVDGLLANDQYGNLVPSVASDWKVSKDGLTYTYTIRDGVNWYTSDGEEYAPVTAEDFVTGLKHAADAKSEALYLVQDSIKGLSDYISGASKEFSSVGVKAIDDHTLQYTLNQPEPYWNSKTTYSVLWPVNADFLASKGDDYGKSTDPSSILYNGPFILKSLTPKSSIELTKNEQYWDKKNVHFDNIKLSYFDGSDQESLERRFTDGAYSLARLYPTSSNFAKVQKTYKDNIYYTQPGSSVEGVGVNIDRQSYRYTAKTSDDQKASTKKALLNKDFRQAINFAIDRKAYAAQLNGEAGAMTAVRNLFVAPDFVQAGDKTFGDLVKEQMGSYGSQWSDVPLADSQDGLYNQTKAKEALTRAKSALQSQGVQFPIHLDVPVVQTTKSYVSRVQSFKQSVEASLGSDNVVIDIHQISQDDMNNITYYAPNAASEDWDLSVGAAWEPDYQDPSTFLDILKTSNSENTKFFMGYDDSNNPAVTAVGLKDYDALVDAAAAETSDLTARYTAYAKAQAWLTDSSLFMPLMAYSGAAPMVSRIEPFSGAYAQTGDKGSAYYIKYLKPQDQVVTASDYKKASQKWQADKTTSNEKAQKDLEKHVAD